jgi:hypothetical protein
MRQRRNEKPIHQQQIASYMQELQPMLPNMVLP